MSTCSFNEVLSHPDRKLTNHLLEVAREADRTMGDWPMALLPEGFRQVALLVCLCHDVGKSTPWFQARLETGKGGPLTHHAEISAAVTRHVLSRAAESGVPVPELFQAMAVVAVSRHHSTLSSILQGDHSAGMLATWARRASETPSEPLARQWNALDWTGFATWLETTTPKFGLPAFSLGPKPATVADLYPSGWRSRLRQLRKQCSADDTVVAQLLFSLLIGADKLDAALYGRIPEADGAIPVEAVAWYREKRFRKRPQRAADGLREAVRKDVASTLATHRHHRLFTLTAPTGAGKTLTALETALTLASSGPGVDEPVPPTANAGEPGSMTEVSSHREAPRPPHAAPQESARGQARIVYCLPFTSIVDQNFEVFRDVLEGAHLTVDSSLLLKHHHLADATWYRRDRVDEEEERYEGDHGQLLIESWKSRVVVTTFVQFLEALLGRRNRMLKKLMQLPGAVVLLDEVQSIPREYWEVVREALLAWSRRAGTRFVLLTATRPLIFRDGDAVELCRQKQAHYAGLDRVTLLPRLDPPLTVEAFGEVLASEVRAHPDRNRPVIVNTIASARSLFRQLQASDISDAVTLVYLSTHLTPRDRLRRIAHIREARREDRPRLVISTQLVEAGVDISMDEVYRDLAPLDAIIQAAGRCNRSGEGRGGRVTVLRLVNENGRPLSRYIYGSILLEQTVRLIQGKESIAEGAFLELGEAYFRRMGEATAGVEAARQAFRRLDFDGLDIRLIQEVGRRQTYFVLADDDPEAEALWETYRRIREEALGREAFLAIKRPFLERVISVSVRGAPDEEILPLYSHGEVYYDGEVGFEEGGATTQIF